MVDITYVTTSPINTPLNFPISSHHLTFSLLLNPSLYESPSFLLMSSEQLSWEKQPDWVKLNVQI